VSARAVVVLTTAGSDEEAARLADALVGERLAACVNVVAPITSVYRWQGKIERGREVLLVVKTRAALVKRLTARIQALHSYDVPEVVVLPIAGGSAAYLKWLAGEATGEGAATKKRR
jgi:periplasmic divalent cation tolerance protein